MAVRENGAPLAKRQHCCGTVTLGRTAVQSIDEAVDIVIDACRVGEECLAAAAFAATDGGGPDDELGAILQGRRCRDAVAAVPRAVRTATIFENPATIPVRVPNNAMISIHLRIAVQFNQIQIPIG